MNNRTLVSIAAIVIVAVLGLWAYLSWKPAGPEQTVQDFYNNWVSASSSPLAEGTYRNLPQLTDNAKAKIDSVVRSFNGLGAYDPVLCAQDKPADFKVTTESQSANQAQVTVLENFSGVETRVNVGLVKEGASWKIDDISCAAPAGNQETLNRVGDYIRENITKLSPQKAATGTQFQISDIRFVDDHTAIVNYDDGRSAYQAKVTFTASSTPATATSTAGTQNIQINSFELDQDVEPKG